MKNFNEMTVVTVNHFNREGSVDKNGEASVILTIIAGKGPNRNVLAGTVANTAGFEVGESYLANCRFIGTDQNYGAQFTWTKVKKLNAIEVLESQKYLGEAVLLDVNDTRPTGFKSSNTADSQRAKAIEKGTFIPAGGEVPIDWLKAPEVTRKRTPIDASHA